MTMIHALARTANESPTDESASSLLDDLASSAERLRHGLTVMTAGQRGKLVDCSPFNDLDNALIDILTWATVAAGELRGEVIAD